MRSAEVRYKDLRAGTLLEYEEGYRFSYDMEYLNSKDASPISVTLPLRSEPYGSMVLFPFFDGLITEGWLLEVVERNWKINPRDRMGLLLACCRSCIGADSIYTREEAP